MTTVETVARRWHEGSDHAADGAAFGSPTCNCLALAARIVPMLAEAWGDGYGNCLTYHQSHGLQGREDNPYEATP